MKSKFTFYVLLVAWLMVFAGIFRVNKDSYQSREILKTSATDTPNPAEPPTAKVQSAVTATPADILLPLGPLPKGLTLSIAIQNNITTKLLRLSEPTINVPGVRVEIREQEPGKFFIVQLEFPQGFVVPPGRQVEFRVKTSNPQVRVIKVPVTQAGDAP
jgi:hypothetical protein